MSELLKSTPRQSCVRSTRGRKPPARIHDKAARLQGWDWEGLGWGSPRAKSGRRGIEYQQRVGLYVHSTCKFAVFQAISGVHSTLASTAQTNRVLYSGNHLAGNEIEVCASRWRASSTPGITSETLLLLRASSLAFFLSFWALKRH